MQHGSQYDERQLQPSGQAVAAPDSQWLLVEFESGGHTYLTEMVGTNMWNVHSLARLNDKMSLVTDVRSGRQLFVTWNQIGVIRLACAVDEKGFRMRNRTASVGDG